MRRREFLQYIASSAPVIISAQAWARRKKPSPSDVVHVGLIGLGPRCRDIVETCLHIPGMRIVAVCDIYTPRLDGFMQKWGAERGWKPYTDFRKMIEKEALDGVMIETTTHARAWVAAQAMAMGMDVYLEKPMCLTIPEGRRLVELARKQKRVTQVGTQQRSMPLNNWASDMVKNGGLGRVERVLAPNFIGPLQWREEEEQPLPHSDCKNWWHLWTNQAVYRPYHRDVHFGWARWWDYDQGGESFGVSGWGTHSYDQVQRALGTDETGPVEIVLEEEVETRPAGKFEPRAISPDETGAPYYEMVRNASGPRAKVRMRYASGVELLLHLDADRAPGLGAIFEGTAGKIEINRDRISAQPSELIERPDRPAPLSVPETQPHIENWISCIRTRERCTADIEYGQRSTSLCCLVNIARILGRVGETLRWNPEQERFENCPEGNALLSRAVRKGFDIREMRL